MFEELSLTNLKGIVENAIKKILVWNFQSLFFI